MQAREPDNERLSSLIESLLLVASEPVRVDALAKALGERPSLVKQTLAGLQASLRGGIRVQLQDDLVQLVTAPENIEEVRRFLGSAKPPALSRPSMETLTIIAYRQPSTRSEIEAVRGVNSDRALQTLLARGLVEEAGRRETIGRPIEYRTTFGFLEYFGLSSLGDLPALPEEQGVKEDPVDIGIRTVSQKEEGGQRNP